MDNVHQHIILFLIYAFFKQYEITFFCTIYIYIIIYLRQEPMLISVFFKNKI